MAKRVSTKIASLIAAGLLTGALAACVGGAGSPSTGLSSGLTAPLNTAGAQMDRGAALSIVNHYRSTRGVGQLRGDSLLDQQAQAVAAQYAATGNAPSAPAGVSVMRLSAGYETLAETFSGWRNSPADANAMASGVASRAGFAAVYNPNSNYGTHWVMLLAQ